MLVLAVRVVVCSHEVSGREVDLMFWSLRYVCEHPKAYIILCIMSLPYNVYACARNSTSSLNIESLKPIAMTDPNPRRRRRQAVPDLEFD